MSDRAPRVEPAKTAVLVMDYQHGILDRFPEPDRLLERTRAALEIARSHGAHVGYVRVAFTDRDLDALPATNKAFAALARAPHLHDEASETTIHEQLAPQPGDIVVRKTRVGAFSTTDLDRQLRTRGVDTLVLAGLSTSGVVLSTVRDAADRDYRLFVLADATADPDADLHAVLVEKVFPRQADVITTAELDDLFAG